MKGNANCHIFTDTGRKNYDQITKSCGCKMGTKCDCKKKETAELAMPMPIR
jgi:hypothetical protein